MANDNHSGGSADQSKRPGGSGNFAEDPQRASEAGKKGGEHSHGGGPGRANESGSERSHQGGPRRDDDDDSKEPGKAGGDTKNRR